jgi:hypothetical protein
VARILICLDLAKTTLFLDGYWVGKKGRRYKAWGKSMKTRGRRLRVLKLKLLQKENIIIYLKYCHFLMLWVFMLLPGSFIMGCGYSVRASGDPMGIKMESMAIPMIESTSSDLSFEADFTRIIREEFIRNSKVPLVSSEKAKTVLSGWIYDIWTEPLGYNLDQQTVEGVVSTYAETKRRMLRVKVDMRFDDKATGKVLWRDENMEEKASYVVDRDPLVTQFNQKNALETIAKRLAKRIFLQAMERF